MQNPERRTRQCLSLPKKPPATVVDVLSQNRFYALESCFTEELSKMKTLFFTDVNNLKKWLLEALNSQIANSIKSDILQEHTVFLPEELKEK